ncbi:hypothetical protein, partial [Bacillus pseudomycoides]|uniref:hypothetical protein n=1 Tax=Bacillus pseudomycoides TaxID=64104 RepID=UPI001C54EF91
MEYLVFQFVFTQTKTFTAYSHFHYPTLTLRAMKTKGNPRSFSPSGFTRHGAKKSTDRFYA